MRIGIDARCFAQGKNTGVEEYAKKALEAIFEVDDKNEYVLFFNAYKNVDIDFSWIEKYEKVSMKKYSIPNKLLNLSLWALNYPKLDKLCGGADIFYMPNSNFCAISCTTKLFLTVHDLSFEHFGDSFSLKRKLWHFFVNPRLLVKRAAHIFVVSEATKEDICQTYKIKSTKVSVTRNGKTVLHTNIDRNSIDLLNIKEKYGLPYEFILYFGTIEPRKNIVNIIKAYDMLRTKKKIKHKLVIAGAKGWKNERVYKTIKESTYKKDIVVIVDVPVKEKESLYELASIFVYPSFFEGFGFPPLEAIACNVPTIVSNTTSLPEVVGGSAIMINPMRIDELVYALQETIENKDLQKKLIEKSDQHIQKFKWIDFADIFIKKVF